MVWYSYLFKFPWFTMIHTFYCFGIIHETEVAAFLKSPCFHYDPADVGNLITGLEKAMAPHSSTLAWKIPWTEEPGRPQSMRSLRVGHD